MTDETKVNEPTQQNEGTQAQQETPAAAEPADAEKEALQQGLEKAQAEAKDYLDQLLRSRADYANYKRRAEQDKQEMIRYGNAGLMSKLLPVVDDFERALQADAGPEADTYRKGVELIYKQLQDVLARRGVKPVEAVGHEFDPQFHQAITYEPAPGHPDGEVIEEVRRGYTLGDRLLRPAMVKVAKA